MLFARHNKCCFSQEAEKHNKIGNCNIQSSLLTSKKREHKKIGNCNIQSSLLTSNHSLFGIAFTRTSLRKEPTAELTLQTCSPYTTAHELQTMREEKAVGTPKCQLAREGRSVRARRG